ncbi:putative Peroxidase 48 [Cannabis sativa]|uniref:putative Peroxidase 48 n=1 Tax=Cannabis sativa TaxID=3483 RepID=UPI0029C9FB39|nr:putative Peroxidase 48 [Cannabis sativa]
MAICSRIWNFVIFLLSLYIYLEFAKQHKLVMKEKLFPEPPNNSRDNSSEFRPLTIPPPPFPIRPIFLSAKSQLLEETDHLSHPLDYDFYRHSCPKAERIVRTVVQHLHRVRPDVAPALLRLIFHDCFVQGCDASVLLDPSDEIDSEKESLPNLTLRGFDLIDIIKSKLEEECPGIVSCADVLVLAARDSVALSGGPFYPVYTGRRDSVAAYSNLARDVLPSPHDNISLLLHTFASRGFDEKETVSLFAAHSIGVIRCKFFKDRLYDFNRSQEPDPSMDPELVPLLRTKCHKRRSVSSPESQPCSCDFSTEEEPGILMNHEGSAFGIQYYHSILQGRGILYTDQQLMAAEATGNWVRAYAADAFLFRRDFALTMMKLSDLRVLTAPTGQIRFSCSKVA